MRTRWGAVVGLVAGVVLVVAGVLLLVTPQEVEARPFGTVAATDLGPSGPAVGVDAATGPAPVGTTVVIEGELERPGEEPAAVAVAPPPPVPPGAVAFPGVGVVADVVPVGVLPSGELQLPADPARVGWWAAGALPGGSHGTVVLAGHMDGLRRGGAMSALLAVGAGDVVAVTDRSDAVHEYRVVARTSSPWHELDPGIFTTDGAHRLVLITCGGTFDEQAGRFADNIVVTAEPVGS